MAWTQSKEKRKVWIRALEGQREPAQEPLVEPRSRGSTRIQGCGLVGGESGGISQLSESAAAGKSST